MSGAGKENGTPKTPKRPGTHPPKRAWQRMLSGRRLDLLDPSPLDIEIHDIAHGLARLARWNGQTLGDQAYSVAQHCLLVEAIAVKIAPDLDRSARLSALLHDAPEYVIGDIISPFKAAVGGDYRAIEARLLEAIHRRFALALPSPALTKTIKTADRIAAYEEAVNLAGFSEEEAKNTFGIQAEIAFPATLLEPWPALIAESRYLARFDKLYGEV